ncbi:hypothetical protein [Cognatiluteimonas profundi]|uniref:hypothetical protein n=1 Tax=Cognatiluteimonas profundi TaxID=2594501 RepID=UPI00131CE387|nr:hypothetical protein [Lysobacter profundi]
MSNLDFAAIAAFLDGYAAELKGILGYSRGQWDKGDLYGEACLAAIALGDKQGCALDLDDLEDVDRLLRRLRSRARSAGGVLRSAERPDQFAPDAGERGPRSWDRLAPNEAEHPLSLLEALESVVPEPEPVDPYHSETAAWRWLVERFDRRMVDIAAFLLISTSWCRVRRRRARHRASTQWQLPHRLLVGGADTNAIQPWRKFKLPARDPAAPGQLVLNYWTRPKQPARGQLWLL